MTGTSLLLGPPALRHATTPAGLISDDGGSLTESVISRTGDLHLDDYPASESLEKSSGAGDTVMDDLDSQALYLLRPGEPPMGLTENHSLTYLSSGNPCLDFFFHVVPDTPSYDLIRRLELAWGFDALRTLKLLCNLRGVRGTGKSDKEGFYTAALWLHRHHPKTLAGNIRALANFGYFKDFPEILFRLLEGPEIRRIQKKEWLKRKREKKTPRRKQSKFKRENRRGVQFPSEEKEVVKMVEEFVDKEKARVLRKERELALAKRAVHRYSTDSNYRLLHDQISQLFAELLKSDIQYLNSGEPYKISLASKWCPTIDSSYDKSTLLCENVARRVFPREEYPEYQGIEEAHYVYRVRDRLRKQVLVPLHKALELPEVFMCANRWGSLPYNRVASVAMKLYKPFFTKHDGERFQEYLSNVRAGKAKIAAGALLPHEIIGSLDDEGNGAEVAELQWVRMVEDLSKKGKLTNCIAVCDVSGSMTGTPMEVSVALGLLVSELSEEPWKGNVITFSETPQLHKIQGDSLASKTQFIRDMDWGANTDFQQVFDRILQVAVEGNLSEDQMIKRIFVFSDMEFDEACGRDNYLDDTDSGTEEDDESNKASHKWKTDYEVIQRKFQEKGYRKAPEIVFWNLRNSSSTPVKATEKGVALVSGFSKNLLTLFIEEGGIVSPGQVMELAISGEEYEKLVLFD